MKFFIAILLVSSTISNITPENKEECWNDYYSRCSDSLSWETSKSDELDVECQDIAYQVCSKKISIQRWVKLKNKIIRED